MVVNDDEDDDYEDEDEDDDEYDLLKVNSNFYFAGQAG